MGRRDFMKVASVPVLLGSLSASVPRVRASSHGWTSYGNDPQNTGSVDEPGPTRNISREWKFRTESSITASAVTGEGNLYVGSQDGTIYAINPGRGTQRWEFGGVGAVRSTPAYYDGTVYANVGGTTYALNANEKGQEWQHSEGLGPASSPNVDEVTEAVYLSKSRAVYALDANDGSEIWSFDIGRNSVSTPALDQENDMLFVGGGEGEVYGRDLISGSGVWSVEVSNPVTGGVSYKDGRVYAADNGGTVYAFDSETGNEVWSNEIGNGGFDRISPTVSNGLVYLGASFGGFYALNTDNGEIEWEVSTRSGVNGSAAVAGDAVYFAEGTRLQAVAAEDGESLWEYEAEQNFHSPIVDGDTVYAGTETADNSLYSLTGDAVRVGASIEIDSVSLNNDTISRNEEYSVTVTLANSGSERGEIELELRRDGDLDALAQTFSVGAEDTRDVTLTSDTAGPISEGEYSIEVNDISAGTLTVGTEDEGGDGEEDTGDGTEENGGDDGNQTDTGENQDDSGGDGSGSDGGDDTETDSNGGGDDGEDTEGNDGNSGSGDDGTGGGGGGGFDIPAGLVAGAAGVIGIAGGVAAAYLYSERESEKADEE